MHHEADGKVFVGNEPFDVNGHLKPDAIYVSGEHNSYVYVTDGQGRITHAFTDNLELKVHDGRLPHDPNTLGKLPGDHAGHIFADQFGGSGKIDNLVSQLSDVNKSSYRIIENQWAKWIRNGEHVSVEIQISYDGAGGRPTGFNIEYGIGDEMHMRDLPN